MVGVTGGTSTPIEDLRDVAERIVTLAGTDGPDGTRVHAADLAHAALDSAATPAGRTTSLPRPRRAQRRRGVGRVRGQRAGQGCLSWPSSGGRTSASRRYSTASWGSGRRSSRIGRAPPVTGCTATPSGTAANSSSWTLAGSSCDPDDSIEIGVQEQARLAIAEADVIVFVVDAVTGLTPADQEAAEILRRTHKPVLVAPNKADNEKRELEAAEFHSLGWEETHAISASHGRGVADLLDTVVWALPPESEQERERKAREDQAETMARDVASGRLEPFVVGEHGDDGEDDDEEDPRTPPTAPAGAMGRWPAMPRPRPRGTRRWRPTATSRRRSRSSAGRTSASHRC